MSAIDNAVAAPTRKMCFVIMPFGSPFDRYYQNIYVPAIRASGFEPVRADDVFRPSPIITDIWNYTQDSSVALADVTGRNANVFYELGLAHASGKPVVIVTSDLEDVPFDLKHLRILCYDKNVEDWGVRLGYDIRSALEETANDPGSALPFMVPVDAAGESTLSTRQRSIRGVWIGHGKDTYVEHEGDLIEMEMEFDFSFNRRQIVGRAVVSLKASSGFGTVALGLNGEFYSDDLFEVIYRSESRKQYGAMLIRISPTGETLDGHYAGFSPTRVCFVMGKVDLMRSPAT